MNCNKAECPYQHNTPNGKSPLHPSNFIPEEMNTSEEKDEEEAKGQMQ